MPYCYSQFVMNFFCKKTSLHYSLLGLSTGNINASSKCGLGLLTKETPRIPNVIESSSVIKPNIPPPLSPPPLLPPSKKKDPGGIGFVDDIGGGVDGLMSCTESLGFESCDERRVDDDDDDDADGDGNGNDDNSNVSKEFCEDGNIRGMMTMTTRDAWRRKRTEEKRERNNKKFPPPLSSLNQNGQPCFYLKPVRENGRLELTEVRIQRPEILRAVRQNGRLRLHLVSSDVCSTIAEEETEENQGTTEDEQEQELRLQEEEEEEKEQVKLQEEEEEEKKVEELWNYRVGGEGFRRCHELVMSHPHDYNHHHLPNINDHHNLHVWRQPCVTTR